MASILLERSRSTGLEKGDKKHTQLIPSNPQFYSRLLDCVNRFRLN